MSLDLKQGNLVIKSIRVEMSSLPSYVKWMVNGTTLNTHPHLCQFCPGGNNQRSDEVIKITNVLKNAKHVKDIEMAFLLGESQTLWRIPDFILQFCKH